VQVASVATAQPSLRSEIDGWSFEDSDLLVRRSHQTTSTKIFIGYTPAPSEIPLYGTVLEMLADGWELLGPPQQESFGPDRPTQWGWWLQRKPQKSVWP
jgi:hypothetical protein